MPRGRPKNPENRTPEEEIALFLEWAEEYGCADIPVVTALRSTPTAQHVREAIESTEQQRFYNIAGALRQRALPQ
jgi:hypothetical protein